MTETISFHIYSRTFQSYQLGYGAAMSYVLFFISAVDQHHPDPLDRHRQRPTSEGGSVMIAVAPAPTTRRDKARWPTWARVGAHASWSLWAIITLFPIVWVFTSSVKTPEQIFEMPPKWIFKPTLHNFEVVLGLKIPTELETVTAEAAGADREQVPALPAQQRHRRGGLDGALAGDRRAGRLQPGAAQDARARRRS